MSPLFLLSILFLQLYFPKLIFLLIYHLIFLIITALSLLWNLLFSSLMFILIIFIFHLDFSLFYSTISLMQRQAFIFLLSTCMLSTRLSCIWSRLF
jgi:hypothetical protein